MKKVYQGAVIKEAPENKKSKDDHMPAKGKSEKKDLSEEAGEPYTKTKKSSKKKGVSI
jgi:hypothetical protein